MTTNQTMRYKLDRTLDCYEPDDVPEHLRDRLIERESRCLEPEWITDCANSTLEHYLQELGGFADSVAKVETWTTNPTSAGVSFSYWLPFTRGSVDDIYKWSTLTPDQKRLVRHAQDEGLIQFRAQPGRGRWNECDTTTDVDDFRNPHDCTGYGAGSPAAARMQEALETAASEWESFVSDVAGKVAQSIEADIDYQTSWECIAERLRDFDELVTEEGETVSRDECTAVADEGDEG